MLRFEDKGRDCHVAFVERPSRHSDRYVFGAVRVIATREGGWHVDRADAVAGTWLPWEPVFDSRLSYPTADVVVLLLSGPDSEDAATLLNKVDAARDALDVAANVLARLAGRR